MESNKHGYIMIISPLQSRKKTNQHNPPKGLSGLPHNDHLQTQNLNLFLSTSSRHTFLSTTKRKHSNFALSSLPYPSQPTNLLTNRKLPFLSLFLLNSSLFSNPLAANPPRIVIMAFYSLETRPHVAV